MFLCSGGSVRFRFNRRRRLGFLPGGGAAARRACHWRNGSINLVGDNGSSGESEWTRPATTDISEFSGSRKIRLISWLGEDVALGTSAPEGGNFYAAVRRVSAGSPRESIFVAEAAVADSFRLKRPAGRSHYLDWTQPSPRDYRDSQGMYKRLRIAFRAHDMSDPPAFRVDFVDGCWFALNNYEKTAVADIAASYTNEGAQIFMWPWNGGYNQMWRAATRGPGL